MFLLRNRPNLPINPETGMSNRSPQCWTVRPRLAMPGSSVFRSRGEIAKAQLDLRQLVRHRFCAQAVSRRQVIQSRIPGGGQNVEEAQTHADSVGEIGLCPNQESEEAQ